MIKKLSASIKTFRERPSPTQQSLGPVSERVLSGLFHGRKLRRRTGVSVALLIAIALIGSVFFTKTDRSVRTVQVERGLLVSSLSVTGNVVPAREVGLSAQSPGTIAAVYVKEGDVVRRGQTLVTLDIREARAVVGKAEANLQVADEDLAQAQRMLDRTRSLYEAGGESRQAVEDATSLVRSADARMQAVREEVRIAHIGLNNTKIQAPYAGLITTVTAQIGQWAAPGARLLTLADSEMREIDAKVDAGDGGLVQVGQQANISTDAYPDRQWQEKVVRLAPAIDKSDTSNAFSVRLSFGPDAPPLRLGQQVDVKIQLDSKLDAVKLPITALINSDSGQQVMLVRDGRVHFTPVHTGIEDMSYTEIVQGIQPGDQVILPESKSFTEGERVRILDGGRP